MMEPPPPVTMRSPTSADNRNGPLKFRFTTASNSISGTEPSDSYNGDIPALFTSTSTLPNSS